MRTALLLTAWARLSGKWLNAVCALQPLITKSRSSNLPVYFITHLGAAAFALPE